MKVTAAGEGSLLVSLSVVDTDGAGIAAVLCGGDKSHVGGVAVAVPRPKSNADGLTCDVSQICVPGHKDVYAAVEIAKMLALATGETVSVTAGVHVDGAGPDEIAQVLENARQAARIWLSSYRPGE